jgi:hypothetical protein
MSMAAAGDDRIAGTGKALRNFASRPMGTTR